MKASAANFAAIVVACVGIPSAAAASVEKLDPVYDAALAGDGEKALAVLSRIDPASLDAAESDRATCIRRSLLEAPIAEEIPPRSRRILLAYRRYWQQAMTHQVSADVAGQQLKEALAVILDESGALGAQGWDLATATGKAKQAIDAEGLFSLTGITGPYHELMIWKKQTRTRYRVDLPDRRVTTEVNFLDGFVSFGWAGYATCNRYHTAGWATDTALFAVESAYGNLASEDFKVSYLAHESRHFSDKRRFPKLEAPELEYRAKLTELALARRTLYDLVTTFARRGGSDRADPHGFADRWVTKDLSKEIFHADVSVDDAARWRTVPAQDIRNAAKRLLARNDALLKRKGADRVERVLGE